MATDSRLDIGIIEASGAHMIYVAALSGLSHAIQQGGRNEIDRARREIPAHANRLSEALLRCGVKWDAPTEFPDAESITTVLREMTFLTDIANRIVGRHGSRQEHLWMLGSLIFFVFGERARGEQDHQVGPHLANYAALLGLPWNIVEACLDQNSIEPLRKWLATDDTGSGDETRPLYFLSYARRNAIEANQVELVLLRENRRTWRDETDIRSGNPLLSSLYSGIDEAHTFVCLLSQQYVESNWCMEELERAMHKQVSNGKPRVVALRIDDHALPPSVATRLWHDASNPDRLRLAISQILREE